MLCGPFDPPDKTGEAVRFDCNGAERWFARFENFGNAGDRPARADAGDKDIDLPIRVAPDLLSGRPAMDFRVGRVLELLRHVVAGIGRGHLLGLCDRASHAFRAGRQDQFRAVSAQQHASFHAHGFWHCQHALVAARGADHRQGNAGIAAGRFDDDRICLIKPSCSAAAIIATPMRSLTLWAGLKNSSLRDDLGCDILCDAVQPHERSVADQFGNIIGDFHGSSLQMENKYGQQVKRKDGGMRRAITLSRTRGSPTVLQPVDRIGLLIFLKRRRYEPRLRHMQTSIIMLLDSLKIYLHITYSKKIVKRQNRIDILPLLLQIFHHLALKNGINYVR